MRVAGQGRRGAVSPGVWVQGVEMRVSVRLLIRSELQVHLSWWSQVKIRDHGSCVLHGWSLQVPFAAAGCG